MTNKQLFKPSSALFFYLILLTGFFLLLEISFFIQSNKAYLGDFEFVTNQLTIPATILPGVIGFIAAQLFLHALYCVLIWAVTLLVAHLLRFTSNQEVTLGISCWLMGLATVLAANAVYFPHSKFAGLAMFFLVTPLIAKIVFFGLLVGCGVVLLLAVAGMTSRRTIILAITIVFTIIMTNPSTQTTPIDAATAERPNIILIGIDSLRPDFLSFFGRKNPTPFLDSFLKQATVFNDAITPLARTYPSWMGILTGDYPRTIKIRFNLASQTNVNFKNTLPAILRRNGYDTLYATDETRFSNIDQQVGFNRLVTPPIGLNDFLLGSFNDFPFSNLIVNTRLGKWLFPYSYANRPAFVTYDPNSFLDLLQPALQTSRVKPLFLATHFCLPHYPYMWADSATDEKITYIQRYEQSIQRVDQQIQAFFQLLQQSGLLKHAIVVVLSDHGEALELSGDRITEKAMFVSKDKNVAVPRFYPPMIDTEEVNQSAGHGTDVLGLSQYRSLLAFKLYGAASPSQAKTISDVVSLLDIKATILDLLHLANLSKQRNDSESLAQLITGKQTHLSTHQPIFLESDYSPEALRTVYPETRQVMLEGVHLFKIDPVTTRLVIKDDMGQMIIHSKQYAVIDGDWILALYPQENNQIMPILVNLKTGAWTNDLSSPLARQGRANLLLQSLKLFYKEEIRRIS